MGVATPPAGSSVTANFWKVFPSGSTGRRRKERPCWSTAKTPAGIGSLPVMAQSSYALSAGGIRNFHTAVHLCVVLPPSRILYRNEASISSTYGTKFIDSPTPGNSNDPRLWASPLQVITSGLTPDLEKDFLEEIFGGGPVPQESGGKGKGKRGIAVIKSCKCLAITPCHLLDQWCRTLFRLTTHRTLLSEYVILASAATGAALGGREAEFKAAAAATAAGHMAMIADPLAEAIMKQFPERFARW